MNPESLLRLARHLGHRATEGSVRTYEAGLRRAASELHLTEEETLRRAVSGDRRALEAVVSFVTVQETYLFRNPEHFELAAAHARRRADAGRPVRSAWSVGCASGEEAWSLAHALWPHAPSVRVVGTDISPRALTNARRGVYGSWSFRHVRPESLGWERDADGWAVPARLRPLVTFQEQNLAADTVGVPLELGLEVDILFCRNVLLYFTEAAAARLMRMLVSALADGGLLVLGALEVPAVLPAGLERLPDADGCAFIKRELAARSVAPIRKPQPAEPQPEPMIARAQTLAAAGELRAAVRLVGDGGAVEEWELAAAACIELGDASRAVSYLRRILHVHPDHPGANLRLALLAAREGLTEDVDATCAALARRVEGLAADAVLTPGGLKAGYVRSVLAELTPVPTRETGT